jgi:hypothetical protein
MRPTEVTLTTWLMGVLNPLGYALLWDVRKLRSVARVFLILTLLIAAGYLVLVVLLAGVPLARMLVFVTCFLCF